MVGDGELDKFLAVTKDAKFGFAGEDLAATDDGRLP